MTARVPRGGAQGRSQGLTSTPNAPSRPGLPLSLRLITAPSWPGALFIAAVAAVFIWGLPWIAQSLPAVASASEPAGPTLAVNSPGSATVTITLADGWSIADESINTPEASAVTLVNAGATLAITPPRALGPDESLGDALDSAIAPTIDDPASGWVVSDPIAVTTDTNDPGQCVTASTTTDLEFTCLIEHSGTYATFHAVSTAATWPALQAGVVAMVESTTFSDPPA